MGKVLAAEAAAKFKKWTKATAGLFCPMFSFPCYAEEIHLSEETEKQSSIPSARQNYTINHNCPGQADVIPQNFPESQELKDTVISEQKEASH